MTVLPSGKKTALAGKTTKLMVKRPSARRASAKAAAPSAKMAFKIVKPLAKRKAKQKTNRLGDAASRVGEAATVVGATLVTYGPDAARQLGLIEPLPKPKRTAPRVLIGVMIGATAVFFLDPENGSKRREKVTGLVS